jgi:DNA-binding CsgD family transcriptional regulator
LREPLTDRELDVLRLLPTHLSAGEIADELSLSMYTVKTHVRSIYGMFGVHRRSEAVERALALELLPRSMAGEVSHITRSVRGRRAPASGTIASSRVVQT